MAENTTVTTVRIGSPVAVSLPDELHERAQHCVTHHFACDCREYRFEVMHERILDLEAELAEAYRMLRQERGGKVDG